MTLKSYFFTLVKVVRNLNNETLFYFFHTTLLNRTLFQLLQYKDLLLVSAVCDQNEIFLNCSLLVGQRKTSAERNLELKGIVMAISQTKQLTDQLRK